MNAHIYMLVGVPGSGKSWVTDQVKHRFEFVHHDGYIGINQPQAYVKAILEKAENARQPLLIEAPFSMRQIQDPLEAEGYKVTPVFIIAPDDVISKQYFKREGKQIPKGHLTRMKTYADRARVSQSFAGNSTQVLEYLKNV